MLSQIRAWFITKPKTQGPDQTRLQLSEHPIRITHSGPGTDHGTRWCTFDAFGHSHKPYHRNIPSASREDNRPYLLINTGSVGNPKDGDPRACYVLLTRFWCQNFQKAEGLACGLFMSIEYQETGSRES
nr:metallophosphoesterase family protein [Dyadobacter sp. MSC1_007]